MSCLSLIRKRQRNRFFLFSWVTGDKVEENELRPQQQTGSIERRELIEPVSSAFLLFAQILALIQTSIKKECMLRIADRFQKDEKGECSLSCVFRGSGTQRTERSCRKERNTR